MRSCRFSRRGGRVLLQVEAVFSALDLDLDAARVERQQQATMKADNRVDGVAGILSPVELVGSAQI